MIIDKNRTAFMCFASIKLFIKKMHVFIAKSFLVYIIDVMRKIYVVAYSHASYVCVREFFCLSIVNNNRMCSDIIQGRKTRSLNILLNISRMFREKREKEKKA